MAMVESVYQSYARTHLICDSANPIVTNASILDESILYNIDKSTLDDVFRQYLRITNKQLNPSDSLSELSGGQKVIIMVLMALFSSAKKICFINICNSLDENNKDSILDLISEFKISKEEIIFI